MKDTLILNGKKKHIKNKIMAITSKVSPMAIGKKCSPITQKAKSSPMKMNEALVAGAATTGKKFVDVSAEVGKAFKQYEPKPVAVDLSGKKAKDEEQKEEAPKERKEVKEIVTTTAGVDI